MNISTRLYGGLGNQIFQFAASLLFYREDVSIFFHQKSLVRYKIKRDNLLNDIFYIPYNFINFTNESNFILDLRLARMFSCEMFSNKFINDRNFISNKKNNFDGNIYLDGYFQECLTQELFEEEIRLLHSFFKETNCSAFDNVCVVHIRGKDFPKKNRYACIKYYEESIKKIFDLGIQDFLIVTDDNDYANHILKNIKKKFRFKNISTGDPVKDFYLIASVKYRILSSSTFCFWASALGDNRESKNIAPNLWMSGRKRKIFLPNEERLAESVINF